MIGGVVWFLYGGGAVPDITAVMFEATEVTLPWLEAVQVPAP